MSYVTGWSNPVEHGVCCRRHSHPVLEIVYHRRGAGVTRLSDGDLPFAEGDAILYAPGVEHDQVMDGPGEDLCIHLALPKGVEVCGCLRIKAVTQAWLVADLEHLASAPELLRQENAAALHHRATALLLGLLELDQRRDESTRTPGEEYVEKATRYMAENFQTIASLEEVSDHVGLSHDHLRHLFKSHKRVSLIRFLTEVRMRRAKSLLKHSRLPLKQIATLCGYKDEYYFSAAFRRMHRKSPGAAR